LARINKPRRRLLELQCVTCQLRLCHLRYFFALGLLAWGHGLRGKVIPCLFAGGAVLAIGPDPHGQGVSSKIGLFPSPP
jgi:hypothetical protein